MRRRGAVLQAVLRNYSRVRARPSRRAFRSQYKTSADERAAPTSAPRGTAASSAEAPGRVTPRRKCNARTSAHAATPATAPAAVRRATKSHRPFVYHACRVFKRHLRYISPDAVTGFVQAPSEALRASDLRCIKLMSPCESSKFATRSDRLSLLSQCVLGASELSFRSSARILILGRAALRWIARTRTAARAPVERPDQVPQARRVGRGTAKHVPVGRHGMDE